MLSSTDIAKLAASGESETVEFKKSTGTRNEAARTLSAMLNGAGGTVLIGVDDSGLVVGQQVSEKSLEDMTQACTAVRPEFPPTIERVEVPNSGGREVLVVSVPSGNSKPYAHKSDYYVRSGAATVAMPAETELALVLERAHGLDRWETAESRLGLDAIDVVEVETGGLHFGLAVADLYSAHSSWPWNPTSSSRSTGVESSSSWVRARCA